VNGFSLWIGLGAALGLWRVARSAPSRQNEALVDAGLLVLFVSLFGARFFYTWINRGYFSTHLVEIPQIWLGGLAWPGAIGGAWIAILILSIKYRGSRRKHISIGWLCDHLYPLLPPLSIAVWLGSWMIGSAYGPALPAGTWWGVPSLDESGIYTLRWPLQAISAFSLLIYYWALESFIRPSHSEGTLSGLAVLGLFFNLLLASYFRADPGPNWNGIRIDIWMAFFYLACLLISSVVAGLAARISAKPVLSGSLDT